MRKGRGDKVAKGGREAERKIVNEMGNERLWCKG